MSIKIATPSLLSAVTRTQLTALLNRNALNKNTLYFVTDENKLAVAATGNSLLETIPFTLVVPPAFAITTLDTTAVLENSALSLALTATQTATWAIAGGADAARFTLSGNTLSMTAKDFESPLDSNTDNVYVVVVQATDTSGNSITKTLSISVTNVLEGVLAPTAATYAATVASGTVITTVTGLDTGANETLSAISPNDGRLALASGNRIVTGLSASTAGTINATVTTSAGRTLSLVFTVTSGVSDLIQKGIDYLGYDFRTSKPRVSASKVVGTDTLPTGATLDTTNKRVLITAGATVTLTAWDFKTNGYSLGMISAGCTATLNDCYFGVRGVSLTGASTLNLNYCDFDAQQVTSGGIEIIRNGANTVALNVRRCSFYGSWGDFCKVTSNCLFEENWFRDAGYDPAGHVDHIQTLGGSNMTFRRNLFDGGQYGQVTSLNNALRLVAENGGAIDALTVEENIMYQPGSIQPPMAIGNRTDTQVGAGCTNVIVRNNYVRTATTGITLAGTGPSGGTNYWVNNRNLDTFALYTAPSGYLTTIPYTNVDANRYMVAATRLSCSTGTVAPTDAQLVRHSKQFFGSPDYAINSMRFVFTNWYINPQGSVITENDIGNPLKIEGASLKIGSAVYPLTFNGGSASATIADGGVLISDPVLNSGSTLTIPANSDCFIITADSVLSGQLKPGGSSRQNINGEFNNNQATVDTNALATGNVALGGNTDSGFSQPFGPTLALARGWDGRPVGLGLGDSIGRSAGDIDGSLSPRGATGFMSRGMDSTDLSTQRIAFCNLCVTGSRAENMSTRNANEFRRRGQMFDAIKALNSGSKDAFTFVYSEHSANSSGAIATSLQTFWNFLRVEFPEARLIQNSVHPNAQDSNNYLWTSVAQQTVAVANAKPDPVTSTNSRWFADAYIRTIPSPLSSIVDTTPITCDPVQKDRWRERFSATTTAAVAAAATSVSLSTKPELRENIVFEPGTASAEVRAVSAVSGTGPYVVTIAALTYAHASGSTVKGQSTNDGVHPTQRVQIEMSSAVIAAKAVNKFG